MRPILAAVRGTPSRLALIRLLAGKGRDSLTLLGDMNQRIYGEPLDLEDMHISVEGRTFTLASRYRTTREIAGFGQRILADEDGDARDIARTLEAPEAGVSGPRPAMVEFASPKEEAVAVAMAILAKIQAGVPQERIAVFARRWQRLRGVECASDHHASGSRPRVSRSVRRWSSRPGNATTPAILSEEAHGLLSPGWNLWRRYTRVVRIGKLTFAGHLRRPGDQAHVGVESLCDALKRTRYRGPDPPLPVRAAASSSGTICVVTRMPSAKASLPMVAAVRLHSPASTRETQARDVPMRRASSAPLTPLASISATSASMSSSVMR